jgi:hypothetical protein
MSSGAEAGIVLLVFGCVTTTLFIVGILRREKTGGLGRVPPPDPVHARQITTMPDGGYDLAVTVGAWVNGINVTRPFARLLANSRQAELWVDGLEPIRIARDEVTGVRRIFSVYSPGVKFRTDSGRLDKLTIWPSRKAGRQLLAELGWDNS